MNELNRLYCCMVEEDWDLPATSSLEQVLDEIYKQICRHYRGKNYLPWCHYKVRISFSERCKLLGCDSNSRSYLVVAAIQPYHLQTGICSDRDEILRRYSAKRTCQGIFKCGTTYDPEANNKKFICPRRID